MIDLSFYKGKRVLVTGHSGFKGTWLSVILVNLGAEVIGYSSFKYEGERLFDVCGIEKQIVSIKGDVRDGRKLKEVIDEYKPEIVFHLAAQPLVRAGYAEPVYTYETNVMGTVNVLEAIRETDCVKSFVNVTTDKVYDNQEWERGYVETDRMDGFDPYSNSKSCSELVTHSFKRSFFADGSVAISTVRAGNVIGGGDFAVDRIVPDCVRAAIKGETILIRNPGSIRPYQHVLEPLYVYLMVAEKQYKEIKYASNYNVGPDESDCHDNGYLADCFVNAWGDGLKWESGNAGGPHEANTLKLDCTRLKSTFGWKPLWTLNDAIAKTVEWSKVYQAEGNVRECMDQQIDEYLTKTGSE